MINQDLFKDSTTQIKVLRLEHFLYHGAWATPAKFLSINPINVDFDEWNRIEKSSSK
jgi:hypothetical protein